MKEEIIGILLIGLMAMLCLGAIVVVSKPAPFEVYTSYYENK